jgi:signal transduction histidine kinase/ligand-binding sensor domain-containing protein/ActR/RegA family two-component response regulator
VVDASGSLWAFRTNCFARWDGQAWVHSPLQADATRGFVGTVQSQHQDLLLLQTNELLRIRDGAILSRTPLSQAIPGTWSAYEDGAGDVWVATISSGLLRIRQDGQVESMTMADGLSYNSLRFIFEDRELNLWVGTSGGGLMRFTRRTFRSYGTEQGLEQRVVKSVGMLPTGQVLAGTYGSGIMALRHGSATRLPTPPDFAHPAYIQSLLRDKAGTLWVGTYNQGLYWWNTTPPRRLPYELSGGNSVTALFEDSRGRVWIGGRDRIACFSQGTFSAPEGGIARVTGEIAGFAENLADGTIYAGSVAGLFVFNGTIWAPVLRDGTNIVSRVSALFSEPDGTLWIGSSTIGLHRWRGGRLATIRESQGLPAVGIGSLIDDPHGTFWIGSNRGVLRVRRSELHAAADDPFRRVFFRQYLTGDGLPGIECPKGFQPSLVRDEAGRLWFATIKGVAVVDPAQILEDDRRPSVKIESASATDRHGRRHLLDLKDERTLTIPAGYVHCRIDYTAFSFKAPERLQFRHTLHRGGRKLDEQETRSRYASFHLLPPGDYSFHVTAVNQDGLWSDQEATLAFTILPFFWQTAWFTWIVCVSAMLGTGGTVWKLLIGRLRRQEERLGHALALAELNDQLRLASKAAGMGFWRLDLATRSLETLEGHGPITSLPEPHRPTTLDAFDALVHPEDRARVRQVWLRTLRRGEDYRIEFRVCPPGSPTLWVSVLGRVQREDRNVPASLFGVDFDITNRIRLEDDLRQAHKLEAIGRLAGGVAHDFNNLLTVLQGNLEIAANDPTLHTDARKCIEEAQAATERASHLTRQLLAFSRKQVLQAAPIALNRVVESMVRMLHRVIREDITLRLDLANELPLIAADANSLEQVLMNLAVNARDAMPKGGTLVIRTSEVLLDSEACSHRPKGRPGRFVRLSVQDTGCGMNAQTLALIFEPFFTTKDVGQGTGLGLPTVHGIVQQHQGWIEVESEPDQGTTFHVFLPTRDGQARPEPPRVTTATPRGTETVLLAEDEPSVRRLITSILKRQGYRVLDASNGPDALAIARSQPHSIAMLVTDITMPGGLSGTELAVAVAQVQKGIRVLYVSGYAEGLNDGQSHPTIAGGFLSKPFTPEQLGHAVRAALDGRKAG